MTAAILITLAVILFLMFPRQIIEIARFAGFLMIFYVWFLGAGFYFGFIFLQEILLNSIAPEWNNKRHDRAIARIIAKRNKKLANQK